MVTKAKNAKKVKNVKAPKSSLVKKVPKSSLVKKKPEKKPEKKRRGRPPGSTNKKYVSKSNYKSNYKSKYKKGVAAEEPVEPVEITWKTHKHLGFCPRNSCELMLSTCDLVSKQVFLCPVCGKRARISKLKAERKSCNEQPTSKKEYLNTSIEIEGETH